MEYIEHDGRRGAAAVCMFFFSHLLRPRAPFSFELYIGGRFISVVDAVVLPNNKTGCYVRERTWFDFFGYHHHRHAIIIEMNPMGDGSGCFQNCKRKIDRFCITNMRGTFVWFLTHSIRQLGRNFLQMGVCCCIRIVQLIVPVYIRIENCCWRFLRNLMRKSVVLVVL